MQIVDRRISSNCMRGHWAGKEASLGKNLTTILHCLAIIIELNCWQKWILRTVNDGDDDDGDDEGADNDDDNGW